MEIWKKLNYIFTKEQKIKLVLLFFMIVGGTFAELFGVTSILPVIQVATEPDAVEIETEAEEETETEEVTEAETETEEVTEAETETEEN